MRLSDFAAATDVVPIIVTHPDLHQRIVGRAADGKITREGSIQVRQVVAADFANNCADDQSVLSHSVALAKTDSCFVSFATHVATWMLRQQPPCC